MSYLRSLFALVCVMCSILPAFGQPPGIVLNPGERYVPGSLRDQYGNPVPDYVPPQNSGFPGSSGVGGVNDGTGLSLGVIIYEVNGRVLVERTIPGTPAAGKLFPNDQLVRGAFRDAQNGQVYRQRIQSIDDVTRLKAYAGPQTRVAMEVYRPTTGYRSFFVTFETDEVVPQVRTRAAAAAADGSGEVPVTRRRAGAVVPDSTGEAAQLLGGRESSEGDAVPRGSNPTGNSGDSANDLLNGPGF